MSRRALNLDFVKLIRSYLRGVSELKELYLSVQGHAEPLVWLSVRPTDLVDWAVCVVLIALGFLS